MVAVKTANEERVFVCECVLAVFYAAQKNLGSIQQRLVFYSNEAKAKMWWESENFSLLDYLCWSEWFAKTKQNEIDQIQQKRTTLIHTCAGRTHAHTQRICIARHKHKHKRTHRIAIKEKVPTPIFASTLLFFALLLRPQVVLFFSGSLFIHWNVRDFVIVCKPNKKSSDHRLVAFVCLGCVLKHM